MKKQTKIEDRKSTAEIVTNRIIEIIESTGNLPWLKPWIPTPGSGAAPRNFVSGKTYQGVNALLLSAVQGAAGYASTYWLTFKQAQDKGGMVRKGEKGTPVVYYNFVEIEDLETGDEKKIPFLRYSTVFNLAQVDGIEIPAVDSVTIEHPTFNPIEAAEAIIAGAALPQIKHGGNRAYYSPSLDYIQMPKKEQFTSEAAYYQTLFHEASHSSGHASRLARKGVTEASYFGSHEYSKEELVAEIAAAAISFEAGIETEIQNSAAYVKSWVKALKDDKNMIVQAAGAAQKAADYILNYQAEPMQAAA